MHLAKFIATYYTHIRILFEMLDIYQFALREWQMTSKQSPLNISTRKALVVTAEIER